MRQQGLLCCRLFLRDNAASMPTLLQYTITSWQTGCALCACRYPFLLVDRVVELESQKYAVGYKCVSAGDHFFVGHFPDRKIMPGEAPVSS